MEEEEDVKEAEDDEDKDSAAVESRLARKLASFGIPVYATIHLSEYKANIAFINFFLNFFHRTVNFNSCGFYITVTHQSYSWPSFLRRDS